jgi:hypothetical protein
MAPSACSVPGQAGGAGDSEYGVKGLQTRSTAIGPDRKDEGRDGDAAHPETICPLIGRGGGVAPRLHLSLRRGFAPSRALPATARPWLDHCPARSGDSPLCPGHCAAKPAPPRCRCLGLRSHIHRMESDFVYRRPGVAGRKGASEEVLPPPPTGGRPGGRFGGRPQAVFGNAPLFSIPAPPHGRWACAPDMKSARFPAVAEGLPPESTSPPGGSREARAGRAAGS